MTGEGIVCRLVLQELVWMIHANDWNGRSKQVAAGAVYSLATANHRLVEVGNQLGCDLTM
jgi:hypothetical protein